MNIEKEKLGIFLAQLRKDRNLTQRELADKLYVSVSTISKWEKGVSTPNIYFLEKIAEVLDVPAVELIECQIDIGVEKATEIQSKEPEQSSSHLLDAEEHGESEASSDRGKMHRILGIALAIAAALCIGLFAGHAYYSSLPVEMEILDSYYISDSEFYNEDIYFVIVEYNGRMMEDMAINYAMEHQENYEHWFEMADGIIFAFFDHYRGREHVMDAKHKVVFVPYAGP